LRCQVGSIFPGIAKRVFQQTIKRYLLKSFQQGKGLDEGLPRRVKYYRGVESSLTARRPVGQGNKAADLVKRCGGAMRIGRIILIPGILALGVAGWIVTSAEASAATVHAPAAYVHVVTSSVGPMVHYHN
jgi:hypothetical protein